MAQKLFVGNLPYTTADDDLRNLFAQAGTVQSANVVLDKMTGRSRGFGFVEMSSDEEAQNAIQTLNGHDLGGRQITVNEARPMESRPSGGGGGGGRSDW